MMLLLYAGVAGYVGKLYWEDTKRAIGAPPSPGAMPGAVPCSVAALVIALIGATVILALETGGEIALGISEEQSQIAAAFLIAMLAAGIVEEVIFRGYLVVTNKGRAALIASIVAFSVVFALLHPHLWEFSNEDGAAWEVWKGSFTFDFSTKAWFSTGFLLLNSLWFYACRFGPWNPTHSILPCFAAHAFSNLGVFFVKLVQGHVIGVW